MDQEKERRRGRAPRADAQHNRERILAAAEQRFASDGLDAQIDAIARDAGVAAGTIYHHFGSKDALLEAIAGTRFQRMADQLAVLVRDAEPWPAFAGMLRYIAERQVRDRALKEVFFVQPGMREALRVGMRSILGPTIQQVLEQAQAAGLVRADVTADDLPLLLAGLPGLGADEAARERYLAIVLAGLRADARPAE